MKNLTTLMTSDSNEWYTPDDIINRVLKTFETIDLDPCSNSHLTPCIPAAKHFTKDDNGLSKKWHGRIYMNPPYGREIKAWVEKLISEYLQGNIIEAIALLPARIDTQWFNLLTEYPWCGIRGRLKFSGWKDAAPFPSCVFYLGNSPSAFFVAFRDMGPIYTKVNSGGK